MEDLVGVEHVHLRELALFEEVVDGGPQGALASRQVEGCGSNIGLAEGAALNGVRFELEQPFDLVSRHREIVIEPSKIEGI